MMRVDTDQDIGMKTAVEAQREAQPKTSAKAKGAGAPLNDIERHLPGGRVAGIAFAIVLFALMLIPLVGMLWVPTDQTTENRDLADAPALVAEDGYPNVGFLSDAGAYFADHYAFRPQMVDADARLYSTFFGVSVTDQVVDGEGDWLYYAGTLNDFQDRAPMRERQAANIAHNMRMLQDYCEANGAAFALTVAPDKNALYPENMPYYYPQVGSQGMDRLKAALAVEGVNYVDLFEALDGEGALLYYQQDSHWNNEGALFAESALMEALGRQSIFAVDDLTVTVDHAGDLAKMLFPTSYTTEEGPAVPGVNDGSGDAGEYSGSQWLFAEGEDVEDATIVTERAFADLSSASSGKLLMYRDSFAYALIPYLACEFQTVEASRLIPFNALLVQENVPQAVVVERAQRHVDYLGQEAPIMPCPYVEVAQREGRTADLSATCEQGENGPLISFQGWIEGAKLSAADKVLVRITDENGATRTYEAFALSDANTESDQGYCAYMSKDAWTGHEVFVDVLVGSAESAMLVDGFSFTIDQ